MFHTEYTVRSLRTIAGVLVLALFMWSVGLPSVLQIADAANVTNFSDTLSDSAPTVGSNHTIEFTLDTAMAANQNFTISFPAGFDTSAIDIGDIDIASSSVDQTATTSNGVNTWGVTGLGTDNITFQAPSNVGVAAGVTLTIEIGNHASFTTQGNEQIVNPGVGTYDIDLAGTMTDTGTTMVAIVNNVLVSANVETVFIFAIDGVANGATVNGSPTTTATTTTSTTLPFETLVGGTSKVLAQDLTVTTNASGGFVVTVEQDTELMSSTGADINGFIDGDYTNTPSPWVGPSADPLDDTTWGHWGLTSTDGFGSDAWVSASTTPRIVFDHNDVVSASTTRVGYQVEISNLQEAGDYSTTLTYIATPTF